MTDREKAKRWKRGQERMENMARCPECRLFRGISIHTSIPVIDAVAIGMDDKAREYRKYAGRVWVSLRMLCHPEIAAGTKEMGWEARIEGIDGETGGEYAESIPVDWYAKTYGPGRTRFVGAVVVVALRRKGHATEGWHGSGMTGEKISEVLDAKLERGGAAWEETRARMAAAYEERTGEPPAVSIIGMRGNGEAATEAKRSERVGEGADPLFPSMRARKGKKHGSEDEHGSTQAQEHTDT